MVFNKKMYILIELYHLFEDFNSLIFTISKCIDKFNTMIDDINFYNDFIFDVLSLIAIEENEIIQIILDDFTPI